MTTHPTPPDQTAAAQEREAAFDLITRLRAHEMTRVNHLGTMEDRVRTIRAFDTIEALLSTQQPEPCVDVEAICIEVAEQIDKRLGTTILYDAQTILVRLHKDALASRGLLTGRTEAKAEGDMVMVPRVPTEEMENAGFKAIIDNPQPEWRRGALVCYRAMISATEKERR